MSVRKENQAGKDEYRRMFEQMHGRQAAKLLEEETVGIAGLGGLGSNVAESLVRAGMFHLVLVDFDRVNLSNLNRQNFLLSDLNKLKTEALQERLYGINPWLELEVHPCRIEEDRAAELFSRCRVVVEAFDDPDQKLMLYEELLTAEKNSFIVAASGIAGYGRSEEIRRTREGRLFLCGDGVSETANPDKISTKTGASGRLFAPRVRLVADFQANTVLEILLGEMQEENI